MDPIPCPGHPGFFLIPGYSQYGINMDGYIVSRKTDKLVSVSKNTNGYLYNRAEADDGHLGTLFLHRALMLTFKYPEGQDPKELTVDHINGNKTDNRLDNLEWVTREENMRRAVAMGLYDNSDKKHKEVETLNPETNERIRYPSIAKAAESLGISIAALKDRLARGPNRVFKDGLQVRYASDEPFIPNTTPLSRIKAHSGRLNQVELMSVESGSIRRFKGLTELSKFLNVVPSAISSAQARQYRKTYYVIPGGYVFRLIEDEMPWKLDLDYWQELHEAYPQYHPIEVGDLASGWLFRFENLEQAEKAYGLKTTAAFMRTSTEGRSVFDDDTIWGYYPLISNILKVPLTNNRQMPLPPNCWDLLRDYITTVKECDTSKHEG